MSTMSTSNNAAAIDNAAAALAADVAEAHGLDGNEQADLTNELLAAVDDFCAGRGASHVETEDR